MALPHRACIRASRKQQVTTLCPGHYPRGTLLAGTQGESHGILAHRKKSDLQEHRAEQRFSSPRQRRRGRSTQQSTGCVVGRAKPGCSAPSVSTALEIWASGSWRGIEVMAIRIEMETPQEEDWGPTLKRDEGHSKKDGWFKHAEGLSASTCWPLAFI